VKVDHYSFGRIGVEGHDYDADVIIFSDRVQDHWWRQEGHRLAPDDLKSVLDAAPQLLLIGTGWFGRMQVPEETLETLRAAGIEVRISRTGEAVAELNRLQQGTANIVAALHLTC
jgi:hypothetical protein